MEKRRTMKIRIYQTTDETPIWNLRPQETCSSRYALVYKGSVPCGTSEEVMALFTMHPPEDYYGNEMGVSDVIQVVSSESYPEGFYYCDREGFVQVAFSPWETKDACIEILRGVYLAPGQTANILYLENTEEEIGMLLEGEYEETEYFPDCICLCNSERNYNAMEPNRLIYDRTGHPVETVFGPMLLLGHDEEGYTSLPDELLRKYCERFSAPEKKQIGDLRRKEENG